MANLRGQGRKPTPTVLKLIKGIPASKLNPDEPQPVGELRQAPSWMDDDQRAQWDKAIRNCPPGLLRNLDEDLLAVWVVAACTHRAAVRALRAANSLLETTRNGNVVQSSYLSIMNRQAELMMKAASELGFSPTSRARIRIPAEKNAQNPFAKHAAKRA